MSWQGIYNPDKPEQIATKAPKHKGKRKTFWLIFIFVPWCLGGKSVEMRSEGEIRIDGQRKNTVGG
jgi:hypothetical protein